MIFLLTLFLIIIIGYFLLTRVLPFWLRRKVAKMQQQGAPAGRQPSRQPSAAKKKITKETGEYVDYEEVTD